MCEIRLAVYGTLKNGFWNHERFCGEAVSIQEATVIGRLYELPSGIPVLQVPDSSIIAHGSANILADLALQQRLEINPTEYVERNDEGWKQVQGELIALPDPARTLPPIDRLEGFDPNGISLYRRVLVWVKLPNECSATAWCYVADPETARILTPTFRSCWG